MRKDLRIRPCRFEDDRRRTNPKTHELSSYIEKILAECRPVRSGRTALEVEEITEIWKQVVGPALAGRTEVLRFRGGRLLVAARHAAIRTEIELDAPRLRDRLVESGLRGLHAIDVEVGR